MIKYCIGLAVICLSTACQQPAPKTNTDTQKPVEKIAADSLPEKIPADWLITPGKKIGHIALNMDAGNLTTILGKPDKQDGAMGAQLQTWVSHHDTSTYQVSVYSHRNMGAKDENISHIKLIRITSPAFKTAENVHTGMGFDSIKKYFHLTANKPATDEKNRFPVYDDVQAGIAFEMGANSKCSAIIVHNPGDNEATYLNIRQ